MKMMYSAEDIKNILNHNNHKDSGDSKPLVYDKNGKELNVGDVVIHEDGSNTLTIKEIFNKGWILFDEIGFSHNCKNLIFVRSNNNVVKYEIFDSFTTLLDDAIKLNHMNRKLINVEQFSNNIKSYLTEVCTIKLDIGRQSSKSWNIKHRATANDLIIIPRGFGMIVDNDVKYNIINPSRFYSYFRGRSLNHEYVFIDNASYIDNSTMSELYTFLAAGYAPSRKYPTIIQLG